MPQVPAVATAMPSPHGNRPVRSAKQAQRAPGCVDSSTLLFDSEDEGTDDAKSESEYDSEDEAKDENDYGTQHIAKKPRLGGKLLAQAKKEVTPPPPDSSCLAYYPALYEAVQRWNRLLGLPPPQSMSDTPGNKMHEVDAPKPQVAKAFKAKAFKAKDFEAQDFRNFKGSVSDDFRVVRNQSVINRNASYDAKRAGFEQLPGEIRSKRFPSFFPNCVTRQVLPHAAPGWLQGPSFSPKSSPDFQS